MKPGLGERPKLTVDSIIILEVFNERIGGGDDVSVHLPACETYMSVRCTPEPSGQELTVITSTAKDKRVKIGHVIQSKRANEPASATETGKEVGHVEQGRDVRSVPRVEGGERRGTEESGAANRLVNVSNAYRFPHPYR